jgi:hypothetical protein
MRARNIKPGFFKNEDLAECDLQARLLFIGLWCMADREGRLECRPKRIKAELFPYDNCNIEKLLKQLSDKKFILIYTVSNEKYIAILNFRKHQNCHIKEAVSTIPAPCETDASMEVAHLNPESPLLNPESPLLKTVYPDDFLIFWKAYPEKVEKQYALKCWKKLNGTRPSIEILLEAIRKQIEWRNDANGEFRPEWKNPATWLNKGCWDDELKNGGNNGTNNRRSDFTGSTGKTFGKAQSDNQPYPVDYELGPG